MSDAVLLLPDTRKRQVQRIVPKFLAQCQAKRIREVRIVHGVPNARTQRMLHAVLKELPEVVCFRTGGAQAGTAGATIVVLSSPEEMPPRPLSR